MNFLVFILLLLFPALVQAEPAIVFNTEQHDFGAVQQGAELEFAFEFRNNGSEELIIEQLKAFT